MMNRFRIWGHCLSAGAGLGLAVLPGCSRGHEHSPEEHEHASAQFTVWSDRYEIFAEHRLVVTNTPTKFITHVTDLQSLQPRREGPIRFILRQGNDEPLA